MPGPMWVTLLRDLLPGGCGRRVSTAFGWLTHVQEVCTCTDDAAVQQLHSSGTAPREPKSGFLDGARAG